jgi:hypothetical protein
VSFDGTLKKKLHNPYITIIFFTKTMHRDRHDILSFMDLFPWIRFLLVQIGLGTALDRLLCVARLDQFGHFGQLLVIFACASFQLTNHNV